jgi:hypothetical protein
MDPHTWLIEHSRFYQKNDNGEYFHDIRDVGRFTIYNSLGVTLVGICMENFVT